MHREPLAFLHFVERGLCLILLYRTFCLFNTDIIWKSAIPRHQLWCTIFPLCLLSLPARDLHTLHWALHICLLINRPPDGKSQLIGKAPDAGKDWEQEEKGMAEHEMVGWHHLLNGHASEQASGDGEGQGSLACCSPWGHKELDMTEWLNNNNIIPLALGGMIVSILYLFLSFSFNSICIFIFKPRYHIQKQRHYFAD